MIGTYEEVHRADYDIESILSQYTKSMEDANGKSQQKKFKDELIKADSPAVVKKDTTADQSKKKDLIEAEEQDKGNVSFSDLRSFLKFSIGDSAMIIYVLVACFTAACQIGITLWLKYWILQSTEEQ